MTYLSVLLIKHVLPPSSSSLDHYPNHLIVINDRHLLRILNSYKSYYNHARCHLSLGKDTPDGRDVHPPEMGRVIAFPEVGGLHHR
jgi:putative transposase